MLVFCKSSNRRLLQERKDLCNKQEDLILQLQKVQKTLIESKRSIRQGCAQLEAELDRMIIPDS